jgi:hypothetical protein
MRGARHYVLVHDFGDEQLAGGEAVVVLAVVLYIEGLGRAWRPQVQMRRTAGGTVRDRIDAADQAIMDRLSAESSPVLDRGWWCRPAWTGQCCPRASTS